MMNNATINFCPMCGDRVSTAENFCHKCNCDLNDYRAAVARTLTTINSLPVDEPQENSTASGKWKKIFIGGGVIFLFAVVIIGKIFLSHDEPVKPVESVTVQEEKIPQPVAEPEIILNEHWISDANDVYLWNPEPQDGESISWSGGYVQDGKYKFAEGSGVVTWHRYGQIIQIDEGTFSHGRHHGQFKHTFKSGRVDYSNWDHGVEIP